MMDIPAAVISGLVGFIIYRAIKAVIIHIRGAKQSADRKLVNEFRSKINRRAKHDE